MKMDQEHRDELRSLCKGSKPIPVSRQELRALLDMADRCGELEGALRKIGALALRGGPVDHGYIFSIVDEATP